MSNPQQPRPLAVKMITAPQNPLGTLFYVWEQSRSNNPVPSPALIEQILTYPYDDFSAGSGDLELLQALRDLGGEPSYGGETQLPSGEVVPCYWDLDSVRRRLRSTIEQILDEDIPCTENLNFVFAIENMSISLREQMVRHRIGTQVGQRIGADIVPDLAESSWWSQTMRMLPMGSFFQEGRYVVPESLKDKTTKIDSLSWKSSDGYVTTGGLEGGTDAEVVYLTLLKQIEFVYNKLIEAGVAMEDARQIIPIGVTHGITWSLNLKAMMHILGKRACWVAQANLWEMLISGMVNEMCDKIDPIFRKIILPPCFKKGKYNACPYFQINRERVQGRDHMPPCPLFVYHETEQALEAYGASVKETGKQATWDPPTVHRGEATRNIKLWGCSEPVEHRMMIENAERFQRLWKLNIMTGEPLTNAG